MTNQYNDTYETSGGEADEASPEKRIARAKAYAASALDVKTQILRKNRRIAMQEETPEYFLEIFRQMMRSL